MLSLFHVYAIELRITTVSVCHICLAHPCLRVSSYTSGLVSVLHSPWMVGPFAMAAAPWIYGVVCTCSQGPTLSSLHCYSSSLDLWGAACIAAPLTPFVTSSIHGDWPTILVVFRRFVAVGSSVGGGELFAEGVKEHAHIWHIQGIFGVMCLLP